MFSLFALALVTVAPVDSAPATRVVAIRGKSFAPNTITISAGDALNFQSDDAVAHRLFSASPSLAFAVKDLPAGGATTVTMATPGVGEVRCLAHPTMKLKVTVN